MLQGLVGQDGPNRGKRGNGNGPGFKITVKGKLIDESTSLPLAYATISLFAKKDSSLIAGGLSEDDGTFSVETRPGKLYGVVEYISYEKKYIDEIPFEKGVREVDLGDIYLNSDAYTLSQVEIRAEKSETQFSLDKKIFNVGKDLAGKGGSAEEILDNVPSVAVDIEGNVSLRGSGNVKILIDGRPSGLVGGGNSNGLRQLPANMIDKVEVITNPSAKYEADGMAGIINIVLRKENRSGYNSTIETTVGVPQTYGLNYTGNYRTGATNFFASYGFRKRNNPGGGTRNQLLEFDDFDIYSDQIRDIDRDGLSHNIRAGIDLSIDEKQTLTGSITYRNSDEENNNVVRFEDYMSTSGIENRELTGLIVRNDDELEKEHRLEYGLSYVNRLNKDGKELSATVQYRSDIETESSDFEQTNFDAVGVPSLIPIEFQRSANEEAQRNMLFQVDFVNPLTKESKLEFGARLNLRSINNDYKVEDNVDDVWVPLIGFDNIFNYDEDVLALYTTYGNTIDKFSYQLGMRGEYSHVVTELEETNEVNDRDYFGLFPSVHLNYQINEGNAFQISYSRRIQRPRFWYLNPFFSFGDNRNFYGGNPNLDPEYTDSYEIGHIKYWEGFTLNSSLFWRHSYDVIERIQISNGDGTTITAPQNLTERDDYGLDINASFSKLSWWRLDGNISIFRSITDGQNIGEEFTADTYTYTSRLTNKITTLSDTDFQLRMNYRGPRDTTQGKRKAIVSVDLGVSRDFMNKKLSLTINARDLFNSRKRVWENQIGNLTELGDFQWRARTINFTATYKIINDKKRGKRGGRGQRGGGGEFEGGEF